MSLPHLVKDCVINVDAILTGELKYKDFKYLKLITKQETLFMLIHFVPESNVCTERVMCDRNF